MFIMEVIVVGGVVLERIMLKDVSNILMYVKRVATVLETLVNIIQSSTKPLHLNNKHVAELIPS